VKESKKKTTTKKIKKAGIKKSSGVKPDRIETPEEVVDRVLSGFFTDCKAKLISFKGEDFSVQGIRGMLALRAGLFIEQEIREPSAEPPWFAALIFKWAFPEETIKISRTGEDQISTEGIQYYSHIPRSEPVPHS